MDATNMSYPQKMDSMNIPSMMCTQIKQTRRRFQANNNTTFSGSGVDINIPISGEFSIDNKNVNLNFKLTVATATSQADFSLFGLFKTIRVLNGSASNNILEQIEDPGHIYSIASQHTWNQHDISVQNAKQLSIIQQPAVATGIITKTGSDLTATDHYISLDLSQVCGIFNAETALPLYGTGGITVSLNTNTPASALILGSSATYTISDVYITCTCLEGGETYKKALDSVKASRPLAMTFTSVKKYEQSFTGGASATSANLLINDRSRSCLGFVASARLSADLTDGTKYKNSSSLFPVLTAFNYQVAGTNYPPTPFQNTGDIVDSAFDTLSHLSRSGYGKGGLLSRTQSKSIASTDAAASGATSQTNVLCIDLAKCPPAEARSVFFSGLNLGENNLQNQLQVSFTPNSANYSIVIYAIVQKQLFIDKMGLMTPDN
jgi:hypothetical protein